MKSSSLPDGQNRFRPNLRPQLGHVVNGSIFLFAFMVWFLEKSGSEKPNPHVWGWFPGCRTWWFSSMG